MRLRYGVAIFQASHIRTCSAPGAHVRKRPASTRRQRYRPDIRSEHGRAGQTGADVPGENVMSRVEDTKRSGQYYKRVHSPVGSLMLVAGERGLAAILWEHERPGRVLLDIVGED